MTHVRRKYKPYIEDKLARALDAICEIEDICSFDYRKTTDEHNILHYEVHIERQKSENIVLTFPILTVATHSSQWITIQILEACGWRKASEALQ